MDNMPNFDAVKTEYRKLLAKARQLGSDQFIANRYPWHCRIAVDELLTAALDYQSSTKSQGGVPLTIRLLTGSFSAHVYNIDLFDKLTKFFNQGGNLKVLLWSETLVENEPVKFLKNFDKKFEIRYSGTKAKANQLSHFLLVGDFAYRWEMPHSVHECKEFNDFYPEIPASICFADQNRGKQLLKFFDDLWAISLKGPVVSGA